MNEAITNDYHGELKLKEIDLLQGCITRMAQNSFMIKRWILTIVVAVVTLLPQKESLSQVAIRGICLLCICAFFVLDSYNIFLERCYRFKYDWVIKNRNQSDFLFLDMSPKKRPVSFSDGNICLERFSIKNSLRRSISLPTVFFYGVLFVMMYFVLSPK